MQKIKTNNKDVLSKLKKDDSPLIKVNYQKFWIKVFDYSFTKMIKSSFFSMNVKNIQNFELRDKEKSTILFASHCSWWDGIIGYTLLRTFMKIRFHLMIEELYRFPLLSKIGAFSVEKNSPQSALKSLNYCTEILENKDNLLWIFPQGEVKPPDYRPIKFANGLSYLYKKVNGVNIIPISHRYNFIREDKPEIFIEMGKPVIIPNKTQKRQEITRLLENELCNLLDKQRNDISNGNLSGYESILKSKLCLAKSLEKNFTNIIRSINT